MSRVEALARASLVARDAEGFFTRLAAHHRAILAAGITRVVDPTVSSDLLELYQEAVRRGVVRVPTVMLPVSTTGYLDPPGEALDGPVTGTGNGPLRVGPVKLFFDGSACALCLTAWQSLVGFFRTCALAVRQGSLDPVRAWADAAPVAAQRSTGAAVARTREEPS
jgi:predicted amidohydrolase YtcJ